MRAREFRARIDGHMTRGNEYMDRGNKYMDRGNELMDRGNELMDRGNELMDRGNELMDRGNELMVEVRDEMRLTREQHRQNMARYAELAVEQREFMREILSEVRHVGNRQVRALDELHAEVMAQREGFLAVLDWLRGQRPGSSGAGA
jgi:hypothetical protein